MQHVHRIASRCTTADKSLPRLIQCVDPVAPCVWHHRLQVFSINYNWLALSIDPEEIFNQ